MIEKKVLENFKGKNALVTGGTGMIGRQVVDILCGVGANVKIVSLDKINVDSRVQHIFGDLTNFDFCKEISLSQRFCSFSINWVLFDGLGAYGNIMKHRILMKLLGRICYFT